MADRKYIEGIGRRKRATARVRIYHDAEATGSFIVNDKAMGDYFARFDDQKILESVLNDVDMLGRVDITAHVNGGGVTGQTSAVRLGLARALVKLDSEMRAQLRPNGHMTRDPRIKERKKPGLKRARKAPTYTKR